jgi:DNA-binding HxlR family transcriptional regulator
LTGNAVNSGSGTRSGAQTLTLLASKPPALILRALAGGPKQQVDLDRGSGFPSQATLRAQLGKLVAIGAIAKQRRNRFPGVLEYGLSPAGVELLRVADVLERWLDQCPHGPLPLGSNPAKGATKALANGWSTTMLRALSTGPLSLTELNRLIASLGYPTLGRHLKAMRLVGQIEARPSKGRATPYAVTDWLRQGVAPLVAAGRWERRHLPERTAPITPMDIKTAFLLTVPLLRLPAELSGSCRMVVEISNSETRRMAGVVVTAEHGAITSCVTRLQGDVNAWALGSSAAWLSAVIEADADCIELGGDSKLAHALLGGLHHSLFRASTGGPAAAGPPFP